jgi:hypothetical protein
MDLQQFRNIPLPALNVTNVVLSYYIEAVNIMLSLSAVTFLFVVFVQPLPLNLSQLIVIIVHCSGSLSAALGAMISCFQIFYVTQFELVFSLDPQKVVRRIIYILSSVIMVPHTTAGVYSMFNNILVDKRVALFAKIVNEDKITSKFLNYYSLFWFLLYILLGLFAFVFIPIFLRTRRACSRHQLPPHTALSIRRYVIVSLGIFVLVAPVIYFNKPNNTDRLQLPGHLFLFSHCLMLVYRLLEPDARQAARVCLVLKKM